MVVPNRKSRNFLLTGLRLNNFNMLGSENLLISFAVPWNLLPGAAASLAAPSYPDIKIRLWPGRK